VTFVSYAQNYEDVMIARALRGVDKGYYIDVGAQDPEEDSVTKAFYDKGWRGINVEPSQHWFNKLEEQRPHDINLQLAASDTEGELRFYNIRDSGLSTTSAEYARRHADAGFVVDEQDVPSTTLDQICRKNNVNIVHFLKVDCEGAEEAALRGMSLAEVRPWLILVEATEPNSKEPAYLEWESLLTGRGYHFVYADGLNRFYVADEKSELDKAFSYPPNIFDRFVRASEYRLRNEHHAVQQAQIQCQQWQQMAEYLKNENERRESALVAHRQALEDAGRQHVAEQERQQAAIAHLQSENQRREEALVVLRSRCQQLEEAENHQSAMIERLHQELESSEAELSELRRLFDAAESAVTFAEHASDSQVVNQALEIERLNNLVASIYASTSWRISWPLRATKLALRAIGRIASAGAYRAVRAIVRPLRPWLRRAAQWEWLRRPFVALLGRDSALISRARLFLVGEVPHPLEAAGSASGHDPAHYLDWQSSRVYRQIRTAVNQGSTSYRAK
jgi:FkbM family methyltransferase